ncbi:hypothetical protein [Paractinoplanes maris]|uniref:hypothetical protein n=1 Tax=Paractinoplanes maris TaxID=1734446 RepID=UPI00202167AF|nr:hypothetical protein [Actinoplanes maris]
MKDQPDQPATDNSRPADDGVKEDYDQFAQASAAADTKPAGPDASWHGGSDDADLGPDTAYQVKADGGYTTVGDGSRMYVYNLRNGREITVLRYHRGDDWMTRAEDTFVHPDNHQTCYQTLANARLLFLRGAPGSGRRFFAEMLLRTVVGPDRVVGMQVSQTDVSLAALAGENGLFADIEGYGIVLELAAPGAVTPSVLAALQTTAKQAETALVVLGDWSATLDQALHPYDALIEPVDPEAVLRKHLIRELDDRIKQGLPVAGADSDAFVQRCLGREEVQDRLAADRHPGSAADLARALAAWDGTDENLTRALDRIRARIRELAARLVCGEGDVNDSPATPRRQAVQIAHAAFDGHSLADVFEVGQQLLDILHALQDGEARATRAVFDAGVDQMLRLSDGTVVTRTDSADSPRRAHFLDPGFAAEVLDVVWNDFDSVRVPLLFWLHRLVLTGRPAIRRRAAYTAGALATRDFEEVWRLLIRQWAGAGSGAVRQAAAWAVDAIARDGRLLWLVRSLVRDWARSRNPQLHDSAARSYGTTLGEKSVSEALAALHLLASRDDLNQSASVAYAMKFLYVGAPAETREALVNWTDADLYRLRVHAARSLILLARLTGRPPRQQWPRLLADGLSTDGADGPAGADDLVDLWRAALTDPTTMRRAWQELRNWLQWADADPDLQDRMVALGRQILAPHTTTAGRRSPTGRSRFYLRQWRGTSATAARLLAEIWPDSPGDPT